MLVLTCDGKGIVMRPDALRPATAKADRSCHKQKTGDACHQGKSTAASGWPSWPASTTLPPRPESPVTSSPLPGKEKKDRARGPRAGRGKWLTASVTGDIPAVIAAAFDEAERRDPGHRRPWAALADGNRTQIEAITAEAARLGITITGDLRLRARPGILLESRLVLLRQG